MTSKWTRATYEMVAAELRGQLNATTTANEAELVMGLAGNFAARFAADNPRFDRARFLAAVNKVEVVNVRAAA